MNVETKLTEYPYRYVLTGYIHPRRFDVKLLDIGNFEYKDSQYDIFFKLEANNSLLSIEVNSRTEVTDFYTLRNILRNIVDVRISYLSLFLGQYYESEIEKIFLPNGDEMFYQAEFRAIKDLNDSYSKVLPVEYLYQGDLQPYFSIALMDFKRAMQDAKNSHFHIFRAMESLRHFYAEKNSLDPEADKEKSWKALREDLGLTKEDFDHVRSRALPIRHGQETSSTEEEVVTSVKFCWRVMILFLEKNVGLDKFVNTSELSFE